MRFSQIYERLGLNQSWVREILFSGIALAIGFGLMPGIIFFVGSSTLGKYEGATPARMYQSVYAGLKSGSAASWMVLLGPYLIFLLFKGLKLWWSAGTRPA
jgi:hypothetical protein